MTLTIQKFIMKTINNKGLSLNRWAKIIKSFSVFSCIFLSMSCAKCHVSSVMCHVSCAMCQVSSIMCPSVMS
jgi:hypothetical protein